MLFSLSWANYKKASKNGFPPPRVLWGAGVVGLLNGRFLMSPIVAVCMAVLFTLVSAVHTQASQKARDAPSPIAVRQLIRKVNQWHNPET